MELAPLGIPVNAIAPGAISTPATRELVTSPGGQAVREGLLITRSGRSVEIAAHLCSDEASHVDGATLLIDGGAVAGALATPNASSFRFDR